MNRLRKKLSFSLAVLAIASSFSVAALKTKPAPEFPNGGAALDVSDWSFRKSVIISNSGPQQLELDLDVLSHAQRNFSDLRLMRQGEQIPYLIESSMLQRSIMPEVVVTNNPEKPSVSRWIIHLPRPHLPITELHCQTATALFERDLTLTEILHSPDDGEAYTQTLAHHTWIKTPGSYSKEFTFALQPAPLTDTLILEAPNGDNPPIQIDHFQVVYAATRILFEAKAGEELFLYYGNATATAPHYDLNLVSAQLHSVAKSAAAFGTEEALAGSTPRLEMSGRASRKFFWGILAVVVVALLAVIARLLPKSEDQPPK